MIKTQSIQHAIKTEYNDNVPSSNRKLDKFFRLYSPNNLIRAKTSNQNRNKKKQEDAVLQLVFPHPNLLFHHSSKGNAQAQKNTLMELQILKSIVNRKQQNNYVSRNSHSFKKPYTAPNIQRSKIKNISFYSNEELQKQKEDGFKISSFAGQKQKGAFDPYSSMSSFRKRKAFTSKNTRSKEDQHSFKQNREEQVEKKFTNKIINRNTFDFCLEQKKKVIEKNYEQKKAARQKMYKTSAKGSKALINIKIEEKFLKYFRSG